jgi:O-acetyl-ADP-ribose deacetylase (regulator of RNase III)/uncharacterized protein YwgA
MIIKIGDIFESKAETIVNTVNCVGVMGKGIALEFKKRFPQMFAEYVELCKNGQLHVGTPYLYRDLTGVSILNFPTKEHWRSPSKLSYIIDGLDWFVANYQQLGIHSIAFPPLGCGNGGLNWETVAPVMYQKLRDLPISIEIYAPYGTKPAHLTTEFLEKQNSDTAEVTGERFGKYNPNWNMLLYIVQELGKGKYTLYVGRTIFQKICYVLTRCDIDTGFSFSKGSYGPFSAQIKDALTQMSNANLIQEHECGRMMRLFVTPNFSFDATQLSDKEKDAVNMTIDLFSRIKNTDQAEMVATVLYAYDCLLAEKESVSDADVFRFVMDWKPRWSPDKQDFVCDTILNLTMLHWMNVAYSNELLYADN